MILAVISVAWQSSANLQNYIKSMDLQDSPWCCHACKKGQLSRLMVQFQNGIISERSKTLKRFLRNFCYLRLKIRETGPYSGAYAFVALRVYINPFDKGAFAATSICWAPYRVARFALLPERSESVERNGFFGSLNCPDFLHPATLLQVLHRGCGFLNAPAPNLSKPVSQQMFLCVPGSNKGHIHV